MTDYELIKPDEQDAYDPAPFFSYARLRQQDKAERDPDIGDVVHFFSGDRCNAAMVLETTVFPPFPTRLRVFLPDRQDDEVMAEHDELRDSNSWHWPCGGH